MNAIVGQRGAAALARRGFPSRPEGWARVRVLLAGICRTDVHAAEGRLPLPGPTVLGHEMVGEVELADPTGAFEPGARVTVIPWVVCDACAGCRAGTRCVRPRMLGVDLDGAFAEFVVVPQSNLVRVPRDLALRRAAYVEPVAAALAVLRAPLRVGQRGVVLGAGRIADLTTRVLRARGVDVSQPGDAAEGTLDFVVEATGSAEMLDEALRKVAPGGVVVLKSRPPQPIAFDVAAAVRKDITLVSAAYGDFDEAVRLAGALTIDDLLGDVYPLDRFDAAMDRTRREPLGPKLFLTPLGAG
jgi:threonine dehydrogenase-like Zn-dependent dehydrogenase